MIAKDIFQYIKNEEKAYQQPINLLGWDWNMPTHIQTSFYYKHGRLTTGNDDNKPVKNITKPILDLQYRTEDIDVKNITLYINDPKRYHLSFFVKKYHDDVFIKENNIDDFLDVTNISRIDYGGGLIENIGEAKPRTIDLKRIAFCDQTDILSSPIGIKWYLSLSKLMEMEANGWGDKSNGATVTLEELIILASETKTDDKGQESKTTGKQIEVYEVYGELPESYLKKDGDPNTYVKQLQFVSFYKNDKDEDEGVVLFRVQDNKERFKLTLRDEIDGRALGWGGAEELFEPQVWVNYDMIRMKELLDAAAKIVMQTDDATLAAKHPNGLKDVDNLEILEVEENKNLKQVDTFPRNINLFDKSVAEWEAHAQKAGAANDSIMGENPNSGTPFKLQELVTQESKGLHIYRRGKYAKFIEEVYRDWILPFIVKEIKKDQEFLSDLSVEEMQTIGGIVAENQANKILNEKVLNGKTILPGEKEQIIEKIKLDFSKNNKKFIKIIKDELKDIPLEIEINIVGKQHNLALQTDKLVNIFRQVASAPQLLDDPRLAKIFNQILESSGLDPIDFGSFKKELPQQPQQAELNQASTEPLKELADAQQQV